MPVGEWKKGLKRKEAEQLLTVSLDAIIYPTGVKINRIKPMLGSEESRKKEDFLIKCL